MDYIESGYIYCLSNQSMPGLIKIGMTLRMPDKRAKELFTTGVPTPFVVEFHKQVENPKCFELDHDDHKCLSE